MVPPSPTMIELACFIHRFSRSATSTYRFSLQGTRGKSMSQISNKRSITYRRVGSFPSVLAQTLSRSNGTAHHHSPLHLNSTFSNFHPLLLTRSWDRHVRPGTQPHHQPPPSCKLLFHSPPSPYERLGYPITILSTGSKDQTPPRKIRLFRARNATPR